MTTVSEQPRSTTRTLLSNGEALEDIVDPHAGLISRRIYTDAEIFEMEKEKIFGKAWFFVGHESEIPEPGDVITRLVGMDPALFLRDDEGEIRVFLNSCRHRGMRVCRTDRENTSFLRCSYHGWAYKNNGDLLSAQGEEYYGEGELQKDKYGLIPVAQLGSYHGLIFATWDAEAPPLDEFLGDMKYYLDIIINRTGGVKVVGTPQIWEAETGWKFSADNFTDNFHVYYAHHSLVDLGMLPNDPNFGGHGEMIVAEEGHILHITGGAPTDDYKYMGLPQHLRDKFADNLTPEQVEMSKDLAYSAGTVFPNFHWLQLMSSGTMGQKEFPFLNLRMEVPISPTRSRMFSWFLIDNDADPADAKDSYETYVRTFGPAGIYDQDDMENWEDCTKMSLGPAARQHTMHHRMGINRPVDESWKGPGEAYDVAYGEYTQRSWYAAWLTFMTQGWAGRKKLGEGK
ncbi:Rieske 2Fe-2S domain-containing protein [Rhodococcus sp. IEGM 1381]|uniref:aromatic ring-hydroxylating oxygenase subunit alpha n=1 Tax=Rhodococcus sp. IEGM 1381 TaxID=3047085 RepID=UPI0024B8545E|nr:Rieske 2Fe-2S domain-containing protein [Rhodococcus sp. IEGM 1381]MDI9897396.1 Rieske 2Fe-2S domain-containing protein [Rhodococcus sp. IEGM 1381]